MVVATDNVRVVDLALDLDVAALLDSESGRVDEFIAVLWDVYVHWDAVVLHHRRQTDIRAENVEGGLVDTKDAGNDGATSVDANTDAQALGELDVEELECVDDVDTE